MFQSSDREIDLPSQFGQAQRLAELGGDQLQRFQDARVLWKLICRFGLKRIGGNKLQS